MTIEGLGKKFQDARLARNLTLDEAARMTKIRPSRLAEIEADDFSQFPSLAYAKGFLLIYGKFLDVDVTQYMEAFETSEQVTVDGYSYLQDNPAPAATRTPVVRRRPSRASPSASSSGGRPSIMPVIIGLVVIIIGFWISKLVLNLLRLSPPPTAAAHSPTPAPSAAAAHSTVQAPAPTAANTPNKVAAATVATTSSTPAPSIAPTPSQAPSVAAQVAVASPPPATAAPAAEPEVRRAEPVRPEDLAKSGAAAESSGPNRVAIRPLKKTYIKVVVDDEAKNPAFERWISPADGTVEFRGEKFAVRVLDRDAVQIRKNGKTLDEAGDDDVTVE